MSSTEPTTTFTALSQDQLCADFEERKMRLRKRQVVQELWGLRIKYETLKRSDEQNRLHLYEELNELRQVALAAEEDIHKRDREIDRLRAIIVECAAAEVGVE